MVMIIYYARNMKKLRIVILTAVYGRNTCQMQRINKDLILYFFLQFISIITYLDYYIIPTNLIICYCSVKNEIISFSVCNLKF